MIMKIKVGIVGSRKYTDRRKVKNFVFKLKEKYGDEVEIVSGGQKLGADKLAKKYALEFDMKYVEFPPAHYSYNQHCITEKYNYSQPYNVYNYFKRNKQIANYSDYVVGFIPKGIKSNGTLDTLKHAGELNKKSVIIN